MLRWLVTSEGEFDRTGVVDDPSMILSPSEQDVYAGYKVPKRRRDWLLGRWTAKRLLAHVIRGARSEHVPLHDIEVVRTDSGEPEVILPTHLSELPVRLSISHSGGLAAAAVTTSVDKEIGIDLEPVVPRHPGLARNYFTDAEQRLVDTLPDAEHDLAVIAIWCAKEAWLKALGSGLSTPTRRIECLPQRITEIDTRWRPCVLSVKGAARNARNLQNVCVKWTAREGYVLALARGDKQKPSS